MKSVMIDRLRPKLIAAWQFLILQASIEFSHYKYDPADQFGLSVRLRQARALVKLIHKITNCIQMFLSQE